MTSPTSAQPAPPPDDDRATHPSATAGAPSNPAILPLDLTTGAMNLVDLINSATDPAPPTLPSRAPNPDDDNNDPPAHREIARLTCSDEPRPRIRSERARRVARWFGIDRVIHPGKRKKGSSRRKTDPDRRQRQRDRDEFLHDLADACFGPNRVTLITGPSGAGKSSLLKQLRDEHDDTIKWIDLARLQLPNQPLVDLFGKRTKLPDILMQLSCVGLGEAWSYLKTPRELSEGQRWRLRLALGVHEATRGIADCGSRIADWKGSPDGFVPGTTTMPEGGPDPSTKHNPDFNPQSAIRNPQCTRSVLVCDEFAAVLDRVTACVVARALRRNLDHLPGLCAIVATSHEDLVEALAPDVIVRCDFGRVVVEGRG